MLSRQKFFLCVGICDLYKDENSEPTSNFFKKPSLQPVDDDFYPKEVIKVPIPWYLFILNYPS